MQSSVVKIIERIDISKFFFVSEVDVYSAHIDIHFAGFVIAGIVTVMLLSWKRLVKVSIY